MRMWKVRPSCLCDRHLLGEHVEMHMFAGSIIKQISLKGYLEKGLVEVHNIRARHDALSREMLRRGFRHNSKLRSFGDYKAGRVVISNSMRELKKRCSVCRKRIAG